MYPKLLLFLSFVIVVASGTRKVDTAPPPRSVSLERDPNYFCPLLSWSSPEGLNVSGCAVNYEVIEKIGQEEVKLTKVNFSHKNCLGLESGVTYSVKTKLQCADGSQRESEPVTMRIPGPKVELIRNFDCIYYASEAMNCTWDPINETDDLQVFYWYENQPKIKPCEYYVIHENVKTGCHLSGQFLNHSRVQSNIFFLFSIIQDKQTLNNSFKKMPQKSVKPPPLQLQISRNGSSLFLEWKDPGVFRAECWDYKYRYKTSGSKEWRTHTVSKTTSALMTYDQRYEYTIQVKAIFTERCGSGATDWSLEKHYGQHQPPNQSLHVVLITIPILVTVAVIISLVFCKKLRKLILPEIPNPRIMLKDQLKDSEERMLQDLFIPCEDVCAKVNIVKEPLQV